MRTLKVLTIVMAGLFIFSACEKALTPEQVAEKFLNLVEEQKFEEAKEYGTEQTQQVLDMYASLNQMGASMAEDEEFEPGKIEEIECVAEGDKAKCTYTIDGEFDEIPLVKQDDKWLVDLKKESPFDDIDVDVDEEEMEELEEEAEEVVE
ncbi:MAG: DUF4878 domain-containing protein [Bacteroidales bacterium]